MNLHNQVSVVVDKCYLEGCQEDHLREIAQDRRLLLTAELACEIFTNDNLKRVSQN